MGCKWDGGLIFQFGTIGRELLHSHMTTDITSVFMMSLPVHESQNLYKHSEFVTGSERF